MTLVKVTNVSDHEQGIEIKSLDRTKGMIHMTLLAKASIELDMNKISDQMYMLAKDKKRRAAILKLEPFTIHADLEEAAEDTPKDEPEEVKSELEPDPPTAEEQSPEEEDFDDEDNI